MKYSTGISELSFGAVISYPFTKILDLSKLKAFADDKSHVAKLMLFLDTVEIFVGGKGENADNQHFLLFTQCFQKASSSGLLVVGWLY